MAIPSSILAWEIPQTGKLGRLQSAGVAELDATEFACTQIWRIQVKDEPLHFLQKSVKIWRTMLASSFYERRRLEMLRTIDLWKTEGSGDIQEVD